MTWAALISWLTTVCFAVFELFAPQIKEGWSVIDCMQRPHQVHPPDAGLLYIYL